MQKKWGITKIAEALGFRKGNESGKHRCDATLKKVMLALDDELTEEEEKKFLAELNSCSYCLEKFKIEKSFKSYLCDKIKRHTVSPKIVDQIRTRIHNTLER
ncbi:MAG TPA: hypothetical protein VE978_07445 [Chitinophagales bacterium]|nr:hypothetical protein [Chitinophagales bacterium]